MSAQAPSDWPEFLNTNMERWNPYENVINVNNIGSLGLTWSYATGSYVESSPAVANGVVYIGSWDNNVYALNASTGAKLWNYTTGYAVESSPAAANGVVYVSSTDGSVYALNASTGALLWSQQGGNEFCSPVVANGVVYVGSWADHTLDALNASSGAKLWSYTTGQRVMSSPSVVNGVVYVGSDDGNLYALNASTGAELWSYTTGSIVRSSPAVANGVVYIGSGDHNVYALNASTGAKLWSYTTGNYVDSSPAVANGVVYIGSWDNNVYALNASTGAKLWSYTTGYAVQESSPAVANGVVYVGSGDHNVYALNASTGANLWSYTTGSYVDSSPVVSNGVVYFGSWDGNVYAFSIPTSTGFLNFPFANTDAYSAEISSVFDHDVKADKKTKAPIFYGKNTKVRAYTGEEGVSNCGYPPCSEPVGTQGLVGYKNTNDQPFVITGHYTGGGGCENGPCDLFLFYTGHSGFDYPPPVGARFGTTEILAPADGLLFIPPDDPVIKPDQKPGQSVAKFDILGLDHGNGYAIWFLHVGCEAGTKDQNGKVVCKKTQDFRGIDANGNVICSHDQLVTTGCPVKSGDVVGLVGNKGLAKKTSVSHLHFEVRKGLTENPNGLPTCVIGSCIPVDPYGWTGTGSDPYSRFLGGEPNVKLWK